MKTVLITGSSRGIGFELMKKFAAEEGFLTFALSRNIQPVEDFLKNSSDKKQRIIPIEFDLTASDYGPLVEKISSHSRSLNILINNAGYLVNKPIDEISPEDIYYSYIVNVFAPFQLVQRFLPMLSQSKAHVVNIGSMGGFQGSQKFPGLSIYSSSKGALATLTECLAEELKGSGVRLNCLALGAVQTEMLSEAFPDYKAPLTASQMADFIFDFATQRHNFINGKIIPVSLSTP